MPVRFQHDQNFNSFYFITFTCYKWLSLFKEANAYDSVYKWFDHLYQNNIYVTGYVVMPNHIHVQLYFPKMPKSLNTLLAMQKDLWYMRLLKDSKKRKKTSCLTCCMTA